MTLGDLDAIQGDVRNRLLAGLLTVQTPLAYGDTADVEIARHRLHLAERAKAMTGIYLFQIEGLIRAVVRGREKGIVDVPSMVHQAWLRWLQLHGRHSSVAVPMDGWLVQAFPRELLTAEDELLDRLAQTIRIGQPISAEHPIAAPSDLWIPAIAFSERFGVPNLARELTELIGVRTIDSWPRGSNPPNAPAIAGALQSIIRRLIPEFIDSF